MVTPFSLPNTLKAHAMWRVTLVDVMPMSFALLLPPAVQAADCYRKALQAADNNNTEYAARVKALNKAIGKKAQIAKVQVRTQCYRFTPRCSSWLQAEHWAAAGCGAATQYVKTPAASRRQQHSSS
jgi:ribonuclease HI